MSWVLFSFYSLHTEWAAAGIQLAEYTYIYYDSVLCENSTYPQEIQRCGFVVYLLHGY